MLILGIASGESVLARNEWQLWLSPIEGTRRTECTLVVARDTQLKLGCDQAATLCSGLTTRFQIDYRSPIQIGESLVTVEGLKSSGVKLSLVAPKSVQFSRPARHGGRLSAS